MSEGLLVQTESQRRSVIQALEKLRLFLRNNFQMLLITTLLEQFCRYTEQETTKG